MLDAPRQIDPSESVSAMIPERLLTKEPVRLGAHRSQVERRSLAHHAPARIAALDRAQVNIPQPIPVAAEPLGECESDVHTSS